MAVGLAGPVAVALAVVAAAGQGAMAAEEAELADAAAVLALPVAGAAFVAGLFLAELALPAGRASAAGAEATAVRPAVEGAKGWKKVVVAVVVAVVLVVVVVEDQH